MPLPLNADWIARSRAAVWHPCTQMKAHETLPLVPIARAEGVWLHDFEGHRFLDAISSWWVNLFGHANPHIRAALRDQIDRLDHVLLAGCTHAPVVELSERLAALAPAGLGHVFFASDGAAATEIALKMSFDHWRNRGYPDKRTFASLQGGYHGETLGALGVTDVAVFRDAYGPLLRQPTLLPCPDARRGISVDTACAALDAHLAAHHATTAALILEPLVQGAAGMVMYDARFLAHARASTARFGVHLIADEIMTGFGRTGTMFAWEQADAAAPDFLCLSKGITGGVLPLSCVLTSDEVFAAFYDDDTARGFLHSHSYTGNPLACRAALAVLDIFRDDDVIVANRARANRWQAILAPLAAHHAVRDFRQCGMIVAFEVESDRSDFPHWFFGEALARELLVRPMGRTIYFMPPYVVTDDEMHMLAARTLDILEHA